MYSVFCDHKNPFYDPASDLEYGTTYYWQVVAKDAAGESVNACRTRLYRLGLKFRATFKKSGPVFQAADHFCN
ncbi:hypothetical protein QUF80_18125 [Desulfococcaceae bacterium HSG8]|nr:hypothetical protein [Desulfococcaceae bacterium HSG8]